MPQPTDTPAQLLFVYNANSGLPNALLDAVHKLVSPSTYACSLCAITYGAVSMRPEWKQFLRALPLPTKFLYRNQLPQLHPELLGFALPAVFSQAKTGRVAQIISAAEMQSLNLAGLMALLQKRLAL
ncbi:hypothetical protein [Hymenobacter oligotrophus]|nr:hypothetical protein [Hymenobacter oligotrophus]